MKYIDKFMEQFAKTTGLYLSGIEDVVLAILVASLFISIWIGLIIVHGLYALWSLLILILAMYILNVLSGAFLSWIKTTKDVVVTIFNCFKEM